MFRLHWGLEKCLLCFRQGIKPQQWCKCTCSCFAILSYVCTKMTLGLHYLQLGMMETVTPASSAAKDQPLESIPLRRGRLLQEGWVACLLVLHYNLEISWFSQSKRLSLCLYRNCWQNTFSDVRNKWNYREKGFLSVITCRGGTTWLSIWIIRRTQSGWMEIPEHAHTPFIPCLSFMSCPVPRSRILCQDTGA